MLSIAAFTRESYEIICNPMSRSKGGRDSKGRMALSLSLLALLAVLAEIGTIIRIIPKVGFSAELE